MTAVGVIAMIETMVRSAFTIGAIRLNRAKTLPRPRAPSQRTHKSESGLVFGPSPAVGRPLGRLSRSNHRR